MENKNKNSNKLKYTMFVLVCLTVSSIIIFSAIVLCSVFGYDLKSMGLLAYSLLILGVSIVVGTGISFFASKRLDKYQQEVNKVIKQVVSGNFDVQIPEGKGPSQIVASDVNKMISELRNIEIMKSDFISNFSHEFKTPIVSIKGYSEILLNENLPRKKQKEFLKIICEESDRLSKLSSNMLLLSNLENSSIVPEQTEFNLKEQIGSCVKLLANMLNEKNITVEAKMEDCKICGNMNMLQQVWINIISNAIKYSKDKSPIFITLTKKEENKVVVKISDMGVGIKAEDLSHIFEKFYQADKSHSSVGNGLGLVIAKEIVTLHGGTISATSSENNGTEFEICLPISK